MRVLAMTVALAFGLGTACGGGSKSTAASTTSTAPTRPTTACPALPAATGKSLPWVPTDLPIPDGAYVLDDLSLPNLPYHSGDYVVPKNIEAFIRYVLAEWPKRGWVLGRGESEPGEAELAFTRGTAQGAFRIRAAFCDRAHTLLVVSLGEAAPPLGQGATTTTR